MKRASVPHDPLASPTRSQGPSKKLKAAPASPPLPSPPAIHLPPSLHSKSKEPGPSPSLAGDDNRSDKRKTKKATKTEAKLAATPPRFFYSNTEMVKRKEPVGIEDIRDLVLHLAADAPPQGWLRVENTRSIRKVVALLIPGITPSMLSLTPNSATHPNLPLHIPASASQSSPLPFVTSTFMHACPTRAPGEATKMHSVLSTFFMSPVSGEEKKKRILARIDCKQFLPIKDPLPYVLTPEQMIDNDYPIPSCLADIFEKPEGWVETPVASPLVLDEHAPKIYALDCEMCMTEDGKDLTRVCVIDMNTDAVVYDQLVKPPKPIIDYLTRFSGITAEKLNGVTKTLPEVQRDLISLFTAPLSFPSRLPILLGHSLESDLRALKICHPRCIDTAVIYHHPRGRPLKPGLAWLTRKWCGREIQTRGEGGHDPEEDARACVELLRKKMENGPGFGEFKTDQESILERLNRASGRSSGNIKSAVIDYGNPSAWHGAKATTAIACKSDEEVVKAMIETVARHDFVFGRMIQLSEALEWTSPKPNAPTPPPPPPLAETIATLNRYLTLLYAALPPRTAFVLFTGHSDPRMMSTLNMRKTKFEAEIRAGKRLEDIDRADWWSAQEGRDLEVAVEDAKQGLLFLCLKDS